MAEVTWRTTLSAHALECERPCRISRQKFPKRTRILSIPCKPYSFHSVHSAIGSRMNGMIFRSFRKWNSSQKNTNTVYSEYSYSGIVPNERALSLHEWWSLYQFLKTSITSFYRGDWISFHRPLGSRDIAVVRPLASHQCGSRPCSWRFFSG